ncbi:phosphoglycerate dehydrogenase [Bacteriovoracaceae bacterium]|nr:phosphoglycerate dehydrogenase [Bacteriovoracaceae bacterium]
MKKVLITTSSFGEFSSDPLDRLNEKGFEPVLNPYKRKVTERELIELINEHKPVALIAGTENISSNVLGKAKDFLNCISRVGVGWDNVDLDFAKANNISVYRTPDAVTPAVAELTLALILDLMRKVSEQNQVLKSGVWRKQMGSLLGKKTVGVMGAGRIGKKVSELVKAFGATVVCFDLYKDEAWSKKNDIKYIDDFEDFVLLSDIVSIHCSYSDDLKGIFNKNIFNKIEKDFYIVNLSRGEMIVEEDLITALRDGIVSGAGLDVFEREPYEGPLRDLDNVVLTPHIGSYAKETRIQMESEAVENFLKGL